MSGEYAARAAYDGPASAEAWLEQTQVPFQAEGLTDDELIAYLSIIYSKVRNTPIGMRGKLHTYVYLWLLADKLWYLSSDMSWQAEADSHHSKVVDLLRSEIRV